MPNEIITLQLGSFSNYVGSHYWNLQDELIGFSAKEEWCNYTPAVDSDVLYTPGEDAQGRETYRPRALFVDLSGSLGGVRFTESGSSAPAATNSTLNEGAGVSTWGGKLEVYRADTMPKSRFLRELEAHAEMAEEKEEDEAVTAAQQLSLEEAARELSIHPQGHVLQHPHTPLVTRHAAGVNFWTDYLKVLLAPKSVYTLPGVWQGSSPFAGFGDGMQLLGGKEGLEAQEELSERIRGMGEACDQLQGFQMLVDDLSGFGGLAAHLAEEINQEYGGSSRPLVLFALRPPNVATYAGHDALSLMRRGLNEALSATLLAEHCQLFVPAAPPPHPPPHTAYPTASYFHTSALLAAAIDTATLSFRTSGSASTPLGPPIGATSLHSLVKLLQGHGRGGQNLTCMGLALPAPHLPVDMQQLGALMDARMKHPHGPSCAAGVGSVTDATRHHLPGNEADLQGGGPDSWAVPLTEGIHNTAGACLAQSTSLRGPRTVCGPAHCATAHSELMALLHRGPQRRCVQHHCVHPLPLLLPLPFPRMFSAAVGLNGDLHSPNAVSRQQQQSAPDSAGPSSISNTGGSAMQDVRTVPVMAHLAASSEFEAYLNKVAQNWRRAADSGIGQSTLEGWGISKNDAVETEEDLYQAASTYAGGESDTEL